MSHLTFLDYSTLELSGKSVESRLSEKEREIAYLRERDTTNADAISNLSDQVMKMMTKIQQLELKNQQNI